MKKLVFCLRVFYTVINTYFLGGVMKQGFTLIELLVVVLIIGLLTAIALPHYSTAIERSRAAEAFANGRTMLEAANRALDLQPNKTPVRTDLDVHISGGQWIDDSTYKTPDFTYPLANGWVQIDRDLDGDGYTLKLYTNAHSTKDGQRTCTGIGEEGEKLCASFVSSGYTVE